MANMLAPQEPFLRKMSNNLERQGSSSTREAIYGLLQQACKANNLEAGRDVFSLMIIHSLDNVAVFADHLIRLFSSCESLTDAIHVFSLVRTPTVYTWNSIVSAHLSSDEYGRALQLYSDMLQAGTGPDKVSFLYALKASIGLGDLCIGNVLHSHITSYGMDSDVLIGSALIDMYAKCRQLQESHCVFSKLSNRNSVSWGVLMSGYLQQGNPAMAIQLFDQMVGLGMTPDEATFLCVLKACCLEKAIIKGMLVHAYIIKLGSEFDCKIGNCLVDMYSKCGKIGDAHNVFQSVMNKTAVTWSSLMSGYTQCGEFENFINLFEDMQSEGFSPDRVIFLCALKCMGSLGSTERAERTHAQAVKYGFDMDMDVQNTLVHMYAKCGNLEEANIVFDMLKNPDIVSWSALISGYTQKGLSYQALKLFHMLQESGFKPNAFIYSSVLMACGCFPKVQWGRLIHALIVEYSLELDMVVGNSLVDMYSTYGNMYDSLSVFYTLPDPNEVTYGALVSGCVQHGHTKFAFSIFEEMLHKESPQNKALFVCILKVCSRFVLLERGMLVHHCILENDFESDIVVASCVIDMYVRFGSINDASAVFRTMKAHDVVSWGTLISGYVESNDIFSAVDYYWEMQQKGITPSEAIFLCILKGCGTVAALDHGREMHTQILIHGLETDPKIESAIVDMYAKSGSLQEAQRLFDTLLEPDTVLWGSMIIGYVYNGNWEMAEQSFESMKGHNLRPDDAIYTNLLAACSHAGALDAGLKFFRSMLSDQNVKPNVLHYNLLVDIAARAGNLVLAVEILQTMPFPPEFILWTSLLTGCTVHGNVNLAQHCLNETSLFESNDASGFVLMLNSYLC